MVRVQTNPRKREKKIEKLRYSWNPQARYLIQLCTIETQEVITLTRTVESACGIDLYLPLSKTRLSAFQFRNGVVKYGSVLNSRVPKCSLELMGLKREMLSTHDHERGCQRTPITQITIHYIHPLVHVSCKSNSIVCAWHWHQSWRLFHSNLSTLAPSIEIGDHDVLKN